MTQTKLPLTVTLISRNEATRIEAAIRSVLSFADEVIVVDSGSTDQTVQIAESLGAKVHVNDFKGFGEQKNFAQSLAKNNWILNIDADERVTPELSTELHAFFKSPEISLVNGVYLPRKTWYLNRWVMHGGWYPNYLIRLSKKNASRWTEPALHEALIVEGKTETFNQPLEHYSFPTQRSHIAKNMEYAARVSLGLKKKGKRVGFFDITLRPLWKFIDGYVFKAGFLDGFAGFLIAIHSSYATFLRYTYLYEQTAPHIDSRQ
jgi:glycosyltransferase involved in cell wall biosynthesis